MYKGKLKLLIFTTITLSVLVSKAALVPHQIKFSEEDQLKHKNGLTKLTNVASNCLLGVEAYHRDFFEENAFSPFYGDNAKSFIAMSSQQKINYLANQTQQNANDVANAISSIQGIKTAGKDAQMKNMSCIGLVARCLSEGFVAAGQSDIWVKVKSFLAANDYDGTALQAALQALGWKIYYWNPDLSKNAAWDLQEEKSGISNALKGYHTMRYSQVVRSGGYYKNKVDDAKTLVNFGTKTPSFLAQASFFVGIAHTGYHVFSGYKGYVIEGHAGRGPLAHDIVEAGMFSPLLSQGKPSGQTYKSGLIAIPPQN